MAGLGRKIFTAGDVLTASDVQNYLMDQTVMTFGGTAARSSAIPTPTTGMTSYIGTTGTATIPQLETYTGSGWQTPYGSTLITKVDFTSATTITIDNVFNATYRNYLITMSTNTTATGTLNSLQLRVGGVTTAGAGYFGSHFYADLTSSGVVSTSNATSLWNLRNTSPYAYSLTLFINFIQSIPNNTNNGDWNLCHTIWRIE